jgi:hypothetical protein
MDKAIERAAKAAFCFGLVRLPTPRRIRLPVTGQNAPVGLYLVDDLYKVAMRDLRQNTGSILVSNGLTDFQSNNRAAANASGTLCKPSG